MTTVLEWYVQTDKISDDRTLVSVSDFHITKNSDRYIGLKNILKLIDVLDKINFDYLLVPGDIINDTKDLEDDRFCNNLSYALKEIMRDKLSFFTLGNRDLMTKGENGWIKGNPNLFKDILNDLSNAVLLDGLDSFSLNDDDVLKKGFPSANINIIGTSLPFEFYEKDKEDDLCFLGYWDRIKMVAGKKWDNNSYNILMLHALKNFVQFSRTFNQVILPDIDFAVGGHYHNGSIPNWLSSVISGNSGLVSPQMEFFPDDVRGIVQVGDTTVHMGGFTNFRVESPLMNRIMGGPYIFVLHLLPLEKRKDCGSIRVKKYLK